MSIDPLYIMLMFELIVGLIIAAGLFGYLYFNLRNKGSVTQGSGGFDCQELRDLLEQNIRKTQETISSFTEDGETDFQKVIAQRVYEMNVDFMLAFRDCLDRETKEPIGAIADAITSGYRDSASKKLQWVKALFEKSQAPAPAAPAVSQPEASQMDLATEVTQVVATADTTHAINKMKEKYVVYQGYNDDIKKKLKKLQEEKGKVEDYAALLSQQIKQSEAFIKELELGNRDLQMCVDTLEKSNEDLIEKTAKFQKVVEGATKQTQRTKDKLEEKGREVEALKKQLAAARAGQLPAEASPSEPADKDGSEEIMDQDEIEKLLQEAGESPEQSDQDSSEEIMDQAEIEKLLQEAPDSSEAAKETAETDSDEIISQDEIERLLMEAEEEGVPDGMVEEGSLEALKKSLEDKENELMEIYNELSPLHEAVLAGGEVAEDPATQQLIDELQAKLSEKEKEVQDLEDQIDAQVMEGSAFGKPAIAPSAEKAAAEPGEAGEAAVTGEIVSQDDLEVLLQGYDAEMNDAATRSDDSEVPEEKPAPSAQSTDDNSSGDLSQDEVAAFFDDAETDRISQTDDAGDLKSKVSAKEDEYMEIFNELSPLHEEILAKGEDGVPPEDLKRAQELEVKLKEKEKEVQALEAQVAAAMASAPTVIEEPARDEEVKPQADQSDGQQLISQDELADLLKEIEGEADNTGDMGEAEDSF